MKDQQQPCSLLLSPETGTSSSTASRVTSSYEGDDDYVFTEDQRKAALELQSLYRKLGLEDLDDGFEEGLSAYDDPHFDIVARLLEVNNRFEEDETPLDSDRKRKVRFKENVVDLVVPISPVRCSSTPPEFDYGDYDDDYDDDDDLEAEELQDMRADQERLSDDEQVKPKREAAGARRQEAVSTHGVRTHGEEAQAPGGEVRTHGDDVQMTNEGNLQLNGEAVPTDGEDIRTLVEAKPDLEDTFPSPSRDSEEVRNSAQEVKPQGGELGFSGKEVETHSEPSAPPLQASVQNGFHNPEEEEEEEEMIHIQELDDSADDSDRFNCSSPEKMLKLGNEEENAPRRIKDPDAVQPEVQSSETPQPELDTKSTGTEQAQAEPSASHGTKPETIKTAPEVVVQSRSSAKPGTKPEESKAMPEQSKAKLPVSVKPKKPLRDISPPTRTRTSAKKPSALPPRPVPEVQQNQAAPSSQSGNAKSRYGLTEELREELRRLKRLEASQKKLREQEQAEERRRRQEDAESAFRCWLDLKKSNTGKGKVESGSSPGSRNSATKKVARDSAGECNGEQEPEAGGHNQEAFRAWLEQKHRQERRERLLQQLQRQHEGATDPRRRDTSRKAYRVWLRRKNGQRKVQTSSMLQQQYAGQQTFSSSSRLPQGLPRALHQAEMLNRTYQAYFGSSLWASLTGLKRHPATLI